MTNPNQVDRHRDFNQALPEYESSALPLRQLARSLTIVRLPLVNRIPLSLFINIEMLLSNQDSFTLSFIVLH